MRAALCRAFGEDAQLEVDELADPQVQPGSVVVDVHAAGVNFADTLMVQGQYQERPDPPFAPGIEAAGVVREVGQGVTRVAPGDRVIALVGHGAYAERLVAAEADLFRMPDQMDFVTGAGFLVAYGTAHGALRWRADLQAGETLVVHGAAGGVGLTTVEVGKAIGATVIATAGGPDKLQVAQQHGADHGIDYKTEDVRQRIRDLTGGRGADVHFDPVGGAVFDASLRSVAWGGRLLVIGFASGKVPQIPANHLLVKNVSALGFYWGSYRKHAPDLLAEQFDELARWYVDGRLKPHVSHVLDLSEANRAHRLLRDRSSTGKVVLTMGQAT